MKKFIIKGVVIDKTQLKNSVYGGPREEILLKNSKGEVVYMKTASDSSAGYLLSCSVHELENKELTLECHETRTGALIIDRILKGYFKE